MTNKSTFTINSQNITLPHVSTLSCLPQGARSEYLANNNNITNNVDVKNYDVRKTPGAAKQTDHIQGDSFGARPKKMRISQRLFIRF